MRVTIALLALVSSALATYEIDSPNASQGWVGLTKQQTVTWRKGSDDPLVININLVNAALGMEKVLASGIEGNTGEHKFDPLNGGWVAGNGYSIRFLNQGVEVAKSEDFAISDS